LREAVETGGNREKILAVVAVLSLANLARSVGLAGADSRSAIVDRAASNSELFPARGDNGKWGYMRRDINARVS